VRVAECALTNNPGYFPGGVTMKTKIELELTITEKAHAEIKKRGVEPGYFPRIEYKGMSCRGTELGLIFDTPRKNDVKIVVNGIELLVQKKEKIYFLRSVVDFDDSYLSQGFTVTPWFTGFYNFSGSETSNTECACPAAKKPISDLLL